MKGARGITMLSTWLAIAVLLAGCGHKEGDGHEHGKEEAHGKDDGHGHGHGEESPSGASFKEGKGVIVKDETKKILGVEVAEVSKLDLPNQIRFTVQVFGENHVLLDTESHAGCDVRGSGVISTDAASALKPGDPVELLLPSTNSSLAGVVLSVKKALAVDGSEVVVGAFNATKRLKPGDFVPARINLARDEAVTAIPEAAVLRTAEGTFVYAVNGDAYLRTAVKVGTEANGLVEITDGLMEGDEVVTKPVETLWLIELRATKGGGHSH